MQNVSWATFVIMTYEYDVPIDNRNIRFGVKAHHIAHLPCVEGAEKSFIMISLIELERWNGQPRVLVTDGRIVNFPNSKIDLPTPLNNAYLGERVFRDV